ncbi:diguanylate cyclase/phosphodiesterase (GGDEF & EAL domains) with PAS/PAC sensor(s) [hydrothermal vent metagenome]|uniref:Diguanylate cyclase/phosphodiesterase (GGDEF & EAL domains) with PAS/PAC sensor(S) n=1 Tax=hydrothermal vent metagenome TaxID=652676 RepID=A0A3B0Z891_9ZZZZ
MSLNEKKYLSTYRYRLMMALLLCTLVAGMLITIVFKINTSSLQRTFNEQVSAAHSQIQNRLNANNAVISALTGWYHSQINTNASELTIFAKDMLENYPHIYALEFMPRINNSDRSNFEQNKREDGYATFSIRDKITGRPAAENNKTYFPITFIEPLEPHTVPALGIDALSDPVLSPSIKQAIATGETVISKPQTTFNGERIFYALKAVYKGKVIPKNTSDRITQVDGVFSIVISIQKLLPDILNGLNDSDTSIVFRHQDFDKNDNAGLLYHKKKSEKITLLSQLLPPVARNLEMKHGDNAQPFMFEVSKNLRLKDFDFITPGIILLFAAIMLLLSRRVLKGDLLHDIENEHAQDALFKEKELAEVTLHSIADGVITTDVQGKIEYMNEVAEHFTGYSSSDAFNKKITAIFSVFDASTGKALKAELNEIATTPKDELKNLNLTLNNRNGEHYSIHLTASSIRNRDGDVIGAVIVFRNVTQERRMAKLLSHQASHDALTGLLNRREFEDQLEASLKSSNHQSLGDVLCYIDLDQFKVVNDTCGHVVGDKLLKQVTSLLRAKIRTSDILARLGGDEFGLILFNCDLDKAMEITSSLHNSLKESRFVWEDRTFNVGASMGLVNINKEIGSASDLLSAADSACYMAKDKGRNRICVYTITDKELSIRQGEMHWAHKIHDAFENHRFQLYRQLILPIQKKQAPTHYEVLIRMRDANGELISPMAFIPAAERYSLMPSIDRWVLSTAVARIALEQDNDLIYNINLSGKSISDEGFLKFATQEIINSGVSAGQICFEITETAAIIDLSSAVAFMHELKALGCKFALDDFGSGLSSFCYLKNLPVDYVKIEGAFVKDMLGDEVDRVMVSSIVQISHVMDIETIAEFVESLAIKQTLIAMGVDYAQGYALERPQLWLEPASTMSPKLSP